MIPTPSEGDHIALLTKRGDVVTGVYLGTIPRRHASSDWFQQYDRWIVDEGGGNARHVPVDWVANVAIQPPTVN